MGGDLLRLSLPIFFFFFFFFFAIRKDCTFYFDIHHFGAGKEKIKKTEHLSE